jgi:alginate O-acetyltransferase complex protein AlgI
LEDSSQVLFNSFEFIAFFLPVSLIVYYGLNRMRMTVGANAWLLFVSLVFYSWWNVAYLPLILGSILFNYTVGALLTDSHLRKKNIVSPKGIFVVGVAANILFLGYFKYTDFFIANVNGLLGATQPLLHLVLPLGISFFTITQIAFLVDAYEGLVSEKNLLSYALFVTFFPHLLAGPILHHKEMMPQFENPRNKVVNYRNLTLGLFLFSIGLFKKVVIADNLAPLVDTGFGNAAQLTFLESWVACFSYTLQLYFDFSGYSDMAIGVGWMFNISLPVNFNSPYQAVSVIDFWKRWHISLSSFIMAYVYTPILRGMRVVTFRNSMIAIFLAMVISGIWHGAGWTFITWGGLHAVALVVNHCWRRTKIKIPLLLARSSTFTFVAWSFVIFRAKSLAEALTVSKAMLGLNGFILPGWFQGKVAFLAPPAVLFGKMFRNIDGKGDLLLFVAMMVLVMTARNSMALANRRTFRLSYANLCLVLFLVCVNLLFINSIQSKEFLYFDF